MLDKTQADVPSEVNVKESAKSSEKTKKEIEQIFEDMQIAGWKKLLEESEDHATT